MRGSLQGRASSRAVDLATVIALTVAAFVIRRHGLPHDGLFFDDAVVGGVVKAPLSHLLTVGQENPGFSALLAGWHQLFPGSERLAYPAFVAGVLGPAVLYLVLARFGYARSIAALLSAALVASDIHAIYAGRVKTYTIDIVVILGLAAVLPRLARMRWRWSTAVAWVVGGFLVGSLSAFALVAVCVAGLVLVVARAGDLRIRVTAVVLQLGASAALFVADQRTYSPELLERYFRTRWDAFVGFDANPLGFAADIARHLRRITEVFPAGVGWWTWIWIVATIVGLVLGACAWVRAPGALRARYLGLIVIVALAGSIAGKFPFGPAQRVPLSPGGRVSLWLVPVVAVGIGSALQWLRAVSSGPQRGRIAFDVTAYVLAAVVVVTAVGGTAPDYPFPGSRSAAHDVVARLGPGDAVFVPATGPFAFAIESGFPVEILPRPKGVLGYVPRVRDPRVHIVEGTTTGAEIGAVVRHARRVFDYEAAPVFGNAGDSRARLGIAVALSLSGFKRTRSTHFGAAVVDVWTR